MPRAMQSSRIQRAKRYLSGGGVTRDDSDDELGLEDHPWEWIHSRAEGCDGKSAILGARMGNFQCAVGDGVLLKAEDANEAWIGLICEFLEDEEDGEKAANFMWFSTEREIRNKEKKRTDFLPNEVYLTPSWDINPLTSINGKATILSPGVFKAKYPSGRVPRLSKDHGKVFICRRGCNTRTATYTEEFTWEEVYQGTADLLGLMNHIQSQTRATRKRRRDADYQDEGPLDSKGDLDIPQTPKKRRVNQAVTPVKMRGSQKPRTPQSKRLVIKKPLTFTPLSTRILSPQHTMSSPFQLARSTLHVSSVPDSLPCRQEEFSTIYSHLEAAITAGSGACIYISGVPGTGKTATVREAVQQLHASVLAEELDDFIFVEINGMKVTDPHQAYALLWEALRGQRVSPSHALNLLEREFDHPNPRRTPCVVLMDELDQLVTKNQSIMYNFFNWPGLRHSRLIVLAVANTMDLPERTLSNKISSRLGLTRITFAGYTHSQLQEIVTSRLSSIPTQIVDPDAIQFASRKVAAVSGDARRTLDICRRAVEIAEAEIAAASAEDGEGNPLLDTPSKKGRGKRLRLNPSASTTKGTESQDALTKPASSSSSWTAKGKITISTIKAAIQEFTTSPLQTYLKSLSLASKIFLAALLARNRRSGTNEASLPDVISEAKRLSVMATEHPYIAETLLSDDYKTHRTSGMGFDGKSKEGGEESTTMMTPRKGRTNDSNKAGTMAPRVFGMTFAAQELADAGVIGMEGGRRGERCGRVRLAVSEEEVGVALRECEEVRGMGFN